MTLDVRASVRQYITQHIYIAQVHFKHSEGDCAHLIERLTDIFLGANPKLIPAVDKDVNRAPISRYRNEKNTWKSRIRKACAAYCQALYVQFDTADLFLLPDNQAPVISCLQAATHADCHALACNDAYFICKRSRKINGFVFFQAAA